MRPTTRKNREILFAFQDALSWLFEDEDEFLSEALKLIHEQVRTDRLSIFFLGRGREELTLQYSLYSGLWLEMDEQIFLNESTPLSKLVAGRRKSLSFTVPYSVLYVPLRTQRPGASGPSTRGVLRLERFSSRAPFGAAQTERVCQLSAVLAENLDRSRVRLARARQLKRLEALTDLTAIFASSLRVEDGLKLILRGIVQHFGLDRVRLYLVDRDKDLLRGTLSVDVCGRVTRLDSEEIALGHSNEHRFAKVLRGERPDQLMKRYEERVLYLPLTVQAQKTGLLVVDNFLSQQPIAGEDIGLLKSFAGQIALAVDNARLFEEVQALSLYDSLTGLPVRRYFNQRFQEELYRVERSDQPLSVVMIDVDYFKGINDTYGHQIGDLALKELGKLILKKLRKIDFPARFGGDEVMILLPQATAEDAHSIMTRLLYDIREIRIPVPFARIKELPMTASIGIATFPQDGRTSEDLLAKADDALYWVKSRGRDGVSTFRQSVEERPSVVDR